MEVIDVIDVTDVAGVIPEPHTTVLSWEAPDK